MFSYFYQIYRSVFFKNCKFADDGEAQPEVRSQHIEFSQVLLYTVVLFVALLLFADWYTRDSSQNQFAVKIVRIVSME